jgi:hypothetical protein
MAAAFVIGPLPRQSGTGGGRLAMAQTGAKETYASISATRAT